MNAELQFKNTLDNASEPVAQTFLDCSVFKLANEGRLLLGSGPTIKLQIGENIIVDERLPKRAAMAFSKALNDRLTSNLRSSVFMLNPLQVSKDAVFVLVDFINGNSKTKKAFALNTKDLQIPEAIDLYRNGLLFGMDQHVVALRKHIIKQINDDEATIITYKALGEVVKLPVADRIYQAAVHKLEGLTYIGALDDDMDWPVWVQEHQEFADAMAAWTVTRTQRAEETHNRNMAAKWEQDFPALA